MLRILVAEEHPLMRLGIKTALSSLVAAEIDEASGLPSVREKLAQHAVDILIMGLQMPDGNPHDAIREFCGQYRNLRILILTAFPESRHGVRAVLAGAHGFLSKSNATSFDLVEAIRKLSRGKRSMSMELREAMVDRLAHNPSEEHERLSHQEFCVMLLIAKGFSTSEIAARLNLSGKTISTYRSHVIEKLGVTSTIEIVHYVLERKLGIP